MYIDHRYPEHSFPGFRLEAFSPGFNEARRRCLLNATVYEFVNRLQL